MSATIVATGPRDVRDQRWLDERIAAIEDGIEGVIDIARNWSGGRDLARLHPGMSAQEYVLAHVKHPLGPGVVVPLLAESNWSNRQIAAVAGMDEITVRRTAANVAVERPAKTLGSDGRLRSAPVRTVRAVVIDSPTKRAFRVVAQTFERDMRRLRDAYQSHLSDERFAARFGAVMAAIAIALGEEG